MIIRDFDITYGEALAPAGFSRATTPAKATADINSGNTGSGAGRTFLWYHKGVNRGAPIVAVDVIYDDEQVPIGFTKVARDMSKGSKQSSFLCYRRVDAQQQQRQPQGGILIDEDEDDAKEGEDGKEEGEEGGEQLLPLVEVVIVGKGEEPGEGFERLNKPLCKGDRPLFLCYRRAVPEGGPRGGGEALAWPPAGGVKVGDLVDLKDNLGRWCVAQVRLVRNNSGSSSNSSDTTLSLRPRNRNWDEELTMDSPRLAAVGTHTGMVLDGEGSAGGAGPEGGREGGWEGGRGEGLLSVRPQGSRWYWTEEQLEEMVKRMQAGEDQLKALAADMKALGGGKCGKEELNDLCRRVLPAFMEMCFACSYPEETDTILKAAVEALKVAYSLLAHVLIILGGAPCPSTLQRALAMVFHADPGCTFFFETYGFGRQVREIVLAPVILRCLSAPPTSSFLGGYRQQQQQQQQQQPQYHRGGEFSAFYLLLLNHWAEVGGFDAILRRIQKAPLVEVSMYIAYIQRSFSFFSSSKKEEKKDFGLRIVEGVERFALGRYVNVTNEELGLLNRGGREGGQEMLDGIEREGFRILSMWYGGGGEGEGRLVEVQERNALGHAWRLVTCPYLNFRIKGLHMINELSEMAQRRESRRGGGGGREGGQWYGSGNSSSGGNVTKWLTIDMLLEWVVEEGVVEVVLGLPEALKAHEGLDDTHYELVRRVESLLALLADKDMVNLQHLDALWWAASPKNPDAQVRIVYRFIGMVSEKFALKRREDLLVAVHERLERDLPLPYEIQHVELIHTVAEAAIGLEHELRRERRLSQLRRARIDLRTGARKPDPEEGNESEEEVAEGREEGREEELPDPLGLNLLWYAVLGPPPPEGGGEPPTTPTSPSLPPYPPLKRPVMEVTVEAIISLLLKQGDIPIVLARYLERCAVSLLHSKRVPNTLYLLRKLSEEQPLLEPHHHQHQPQLSSRPVAKVARAKLLTYLSEVAGDGGIFAVILEGLKTYRERARAAAVTKGILPLQQRVKKERGKEAEQEEEEEEEGDILMDSVLGREGGSGLTYKEEIAERLDFMRYVAENSERELLLEFRPHLLPLWEMMVVRPLCKAEREMTYDWLTSLAPEETAAAAVAVAAVSVGRYGGRGDGGAGPSACMLPATALELFRECLASGGRKGGREGGAGYRCLERYFRVVNGWEGRLTAPLSERGLVVRDFKGLEGMDAIWQAYWSASSSGVVESAGEFLIHLHLRLQLKEGEEGRKGGRVGVWKELMEHCKTIIMVREGGRERGAVVVRRALALLRLFLGELQTPPVVGRGTRKGKGSFGGAYEVGKDEVGVVVEVRRLEESSRAKRGQCVTELRYIFRNEEVSVGALRARVALDMGSREGGAQRVRLMTSPTNSILHAEQHDVMPLDNNRGNSPYRKFTAILLPRPLPDTLRVDLSTPPAVSLQAQGEDEERHEEGLPLRELSRDKMFWETVFALVGPEPSLVGDAWLLLEMVPAIPWIEESIRSLGGALSLPDSSGFRKRSSSTTDGIDGVASNTSSGSSSNSNSGSGSDIRTWEALLHGRSPMRFLYNLQLIQDRILFPSTDPYSSPSSRGTSLRWELAFVKMGGLAYLVEVLAGWDLASESKNPTLHKNTLSALIQRIGKFMTSNQEEMVLRGREEDGGALGGKVAAMARGLAGRRHHISFSSSSSLFVGAGEGDGGGAGPGEGLILRDVNVDVVMEEDGGQKERISNGLVAGMARVGLEGTGEEEEGEEKAVTAAAERAAAQAAEEKGEEEERRRRCVHRASAAVFARVDREALTSRLVEVLYEATKSARDRPPSSRPPTDDTTGSDDDDSPSTSPWQPSVPLPTVTVAAAAATAIVSGPRPRRGSLGGCGGGMMRGARDLLRRPSWVDQNEWTGELFPPSETIALAAAPAGAAAPSGALVGGTPSEDVALVQATLDLLVTLGAGGAGLLDVILGSERLKPLLRFGLVEAPDEELRKAVAKGVHRLCVEGRRRRQRKEEEAEEATAAAVAVAAAEDKEEREENSRRRTAAAAAAAATLPGEGGADPVRGFLGALIELLELVEEEPGGACVEYFKIMTRLIKAPDALLDIEPQGVAQRLAGQITHRKVVEATEADEDKALQGLLTTLRALLAFFPHRNNVTRTVKVSLGKSGLLRELFDRCLFAMPSTDPTAPRFTETPPPPKCKHPTSRDLALGLVLELSAECPENLREVVSVLEKHNPLGVSTEEKERRRARVARRRSKNNSNQGAAWGRRRSESGSTGGALALGAASSSAAASSLQLGLSKSRTGYVGLKNLGCICYMNSTLQQLWHVKGFREGILSFGGGEEGEGEGGREESMMWQLQCLFAHLQETDKAYYNPRGFCTALKNWEGEPTDVYVQQDVSDFLLMFFQQVEGMTQGTNCEDVLRREFGGVIVHELIAEGGRYSSREEPCYFLSVMVQNLRTLEQALEAYIAEEVLGDYTWERKRVVGEQGKEEVVKEALPTVKRASLRALPRHLILHLKRFEFDYETMQQIKINDRLEFPAELDMFPYTLEGRVAAETAAAAAAAAAAGGGIRAGGGEGGGGISTGTASEERRSGGGHLREYYTYKLAGVVIHMGTANSGHYYSYIRERGGGRERGSGGRKKAGWFEFNDTVVSEFDPADLEEECFGGQETGGGGGGREWTRERIRNAFLLVYDRCDVAAEEEAPAAAAHRPAVPPGILEEILRENLEFWRKTNILTRAYFEFMDQLLEPFYSPNLHEREREDDEGGGGLLERGLRLATQFMLGTLMDARDWEGVREWNRRLCRAYESCVPACLWFVRLLSSVEGEGGKEGGLLWELLVETEEREGRVAVVQLIDRVVNVLLEEKAGEGGKKRGSEDVCLELFQALLNMRGRVMGLPRQGAAKVDCYLFLLGRMLERIEGAREMVLEGNSSSSSCLLDLLQLVNGALELWALGRNNGENGQHDNGLLLLGNGGNGSSSSSSSSNSSSSVGAAVGGEDGEEGGGSLDVSEVVQPLLSHLLRACVIAMENGESPVNPSLWSALALPPHHVMSAGEMRVVCSIDFCARLILSVSSPGAKERMRDLFTHLLWENIGRSDDMNAAMGKLLESGGGGEGGEEEEGVGGVVKPVFRSLMLVLQVGDSLQERRIAVMLTTVLAALESHAERRSERTVERGLMMLMRVARGNALVRQWFHDGAVVESVVASPERKGKSPKRTASFTSLLTFGAVGGGGGEKGKDGGRMTVDEDEDEEKRMVSRDQVQWAERWLLEHEGGRGNGLGIPLGKGGEFFNAAASASSWIGGGGKGHQAVAANTVGGRGRGSMRTGALLQQRLLAGIRNLSRGQDMPLNYDSDMDPMAVVGKCVKIKWSGNEHYTGRISHYSPRSGKHHVRYEDGDERDYVLSERQHVIVDQSSPLSSFEQADD